MYRYQVISEADGVPVLDDLTAAFVSEGANRREAGEIVFNEGVGFNPVPYEAAVGRLCRVVRTDDDDQVSERTGAVDRMQPVVIVQLDGGGWP